MIKIGPNRKKSKKKKLIKDLNRQQKNNTIENIKLKFKNIFNRSLSNYNIKYILYQIRIENSAIKIGDIDCFNSLYIVNIDFKKNKSMKIVVIYNSLTQFIHNCYSIEQLKTLNKNKIYFKTLEYFN